MNRDEEILKIHIQIGGFRIPMKVPRKDEEIYRKAERLVVRFMDEYQKIYQQRATEEILILVAFRLAVVISKHEVDQDSDLIIDRLKSLDNELTELLSIK